MKSASSAAGARFPDAADLCVTGQQGITCDSDTSSLVQQQFSEVRLQARAKVGGSFAVKDRNTECVHLRWVGEGALGFLFVPLCDSAG